MPYLMESLELLNEGVPAVAIDRAATDFGMPMGPVELADTVGLDICKSVAGHLTEAYGGTVPKVLIDKVDNNERGKKDGKGFYEWKSGRPQKDKYDPETVGADTEDRLILRFLNESVACLREGVVASADELDAGYINSVGSTKLHARLENLARKHGARFQPDEGWTYLLSTDTGSKPE